jgi:amidohydrolase
MALISNKLKREMISWRHHLHRHPELGFSENKTADFVAELLRNWGIEVIENIGKTGVIGVLKKGHSKNSVGLRADMDALNIQELNEFSYRSKHEHIMHACGHDGHTSMLLGAAKKLARDGEFDGTVFFIFQPAEEHGKGALAMIDDGLFDNYQIDEIYGLHNLPGLAAGHFAIRPGAIMASESNFEIRIQGTGGHAAMPHSGVDIMLVASQVVVALQTIVARNLDILHQPAVVSVTEFITDGTVNVLPSRVTLKGDCRCFSDGSVAQIEASMRRIVDGVCAAAGATVELEFNTSFPPTVNSVAATSKAIQAARQALGEERVNGNCDPFTISEDFANMLKLRPGCYALLGNGGEAGSACALHNPHYDFNDDILADGAAYWVQLVHNQLAV